MIDFFSKLYAIVGNRYSLLRKIKFYAFLRFIISVACNMLLPIWLKITSSFKSNRLLYAKGGSGRIIVSMTSFDRRINRVWIVIESILRQSHKPDMIILWLSKDEFPTKEYLPRNLLKLQERGLIINLREGNLMSHKKYYYTLLEYPDDHLITIDDDIIYPSDFIASLLKGHEIYPDAVISRFAFKLKYDEKGDLLSYAVWSSVMINQPTSPSFDVFFGSGGGTFFPSNILGEEAKNISLAMTTCKFADDVWLNTMCRLNGKKVAVVDSLFSFLPIMNVNNFKLSSINNVQNQNDVQIANLIKYYVIHNHLNPYSIK